MRIVHVHFVVLFMRALYIVIYHSISQSYSGFRYITRYCSRNFHYVSKRDKKEKNIEIIVLGKRRGVIGRMALEPCNYPAILSLSGRRKLAKQTWNGHYVFSISALTSKQLPRRRYRFFFRAQLQKNYIHFECNSFQSEGERRIARRDRLPKVWTRLD